MSSGTLWYDGVPVEGVDLKSICLSGLPRSSITFPFRSEYTITVPAHHSSKRKLQKWVISLMKNPRYRGPRKTK